MQRIQLQEVVGQVGGSGEPLVHQQEPDGHLFLGVQQAFGCIGGVWLGASLVVGLEVGLGT